MFEADLSDYNNNSEKLGVLEKDIEQLKQKIKKLNEEYAEKENMGNAHRLNDIQKEIINLEKKLDEYMLTRKKNANEQVCKIKNDLNQIRDDFNKAFEFQTQKAEKIQKRINSLKTDISNIEQVQANLRRQMDHDREEQERRRREDWIERDREFQRRLEEHDRQRNDSNDTGCYIS